MKPRTVSVARERAGRGSLASQPRRQCERTPKGARCRDEFAPREAMAYHATVIAPIFTTAITCNRGAAPPVPGGAEARAIVEPRHVYEVIIEGNTHEVATEIAHPATARHAR